MFLENFTFTNLLITENTIRLADSVSALLQASNKDYKFS